jgi:CheY-like chemotaxis protein
LAEAAIRHGVYPGSTRGANKEYSGTGIGLTLLAKRMELMGEGTHGRSRLGVESEAGGATGTSSNILPLKETSQSMHKPVLYVEDEEADAFFMSLAFREMGIPTPVIVVSDGQQALDYLQGRNEYADRALHPLPCLVLLDLNLPKLSGFEVLAWIRSRPEFTDLPVVIFSGSGLEVDKQAAKQGGANDYIVKPNDLTLIPQLLEPLISRWPL